MPTMILPYLWLGDYNDCVYIPSFSKVVVNCTTDVPFFHRDVVNIRIPLCEHMNEFEKAKLWDNKENFDIILGSIINKQNILFHSKNGFDASSACIVALMMKMNRLPKLSAINSLKYKVSSTYINLKNYDY